MSLLQNPFLHSKFALNALEFVGLVGGAEVISAMGLLPLYRGSYWLRWYNTPGSFDVARHLFKLATSGGPSQAFRKPEPPAVTFGFDGMTGPKYLDVSSLMEVQTGHLGYLVTEWCRDSGETVVDIMGRRTVPMEIALVQLGEVNYDFAVPPLPFVQIIYAIFPILTSLGCCLMCALVGDYYMTSVIAIGIFTTGFVSIVIGSGKLTLSQETDKAVRRAPLLSGFFLPNPKENRVVVLKGRGEAISLITEGYFTLELGKTPFSLHFIAITIGSVFFAIECLAQLLLIPQGTVFGQVMFIVSLMVSWTYSFYLASFKKERTQAQILFSKLRDHKILKFLAGTRVTMVTFLAFLLFDAVDNPREEAIQKVLRSFLPNDTHVWEVWREKVTLQICDRSTSHLDEDADDLADLDRMLLRTLLDDAKAAFAAFHKHQHH